MTDHNPNGAMTLEMLRQAHYQVARHVPKKIYLHESMRQHPDFKDNPDIVFFKSPELLDKGFLVDGDLFDGYSMSQHPSRSALHDDMIDALRFAMWPRKLSRWQASIIKIKMLVSRFLKSISLKNVVRAIIYLLITLAMVALLNGSSLVV
jgi:hypothetical protein